MYKWHKSFAEINCPSEQVNLLNQVLLNIFSNFIPNKIAKVKPQQAPWITKAIKSFLRKRNRAYTFFTKSRYSQERSEMTQQMTLQGTRLVEEAKQKYFLKVGQTISRADTGNKLYWSLINRVLNKVKIPLIPPLLENGKFVLDFESKVQIFNHYFLLQCTTLDTGSEIPNATSSYVPALTGLQISDEKILGVIRSLNSSKAHGWDDISIRMIKICDQALITPLKIIYENCIAKGVFHKF